MAPRKFFGRALVRVPIRRERCRRRLEKKIGDALHGGNNDREMARRCADMFTRNLQGFRAPDGRSAKLVDVDRITHDRSIQSRDMWTSIRKFTDIKYERTEDGIAKITINRPEMRNAFRPQT